MESLQIGSQPLDLLCSSLPSSSFPWGQMSSHSRVEHGEKVLDSDYSFGEKSQPLTSPSSINPNADDAPDGGVLAWLQVAGGFFVLMNTWYVYNTRT
jgi:hypothetical protein